MTQTIWSVLPPVITIALALLTKEVYISLLVGIFTGTLLFTEFNFLQSIVTMLTILTDKVGGNVNILAFLIILGILVAMITHSGAVRAYGEWASRTLQGKRSSLLCAGLLGIIVFIDDYFSCLTVGTVMRPVTDRFGVSRAKLAYLIDSTAAPICILAPVSSWAAAVGSSLPEGSQVDGFGLFLQTIPMNIYAILTVAFMLFIAWTGRDFSTMRRHVEQNQQAFIIPEEYAEARENEISLAEGRGRILDLILPLVVLVAACVQGMLYTGGIYEGKGLIDAFANCDSAQSLAIGSFMAFLFTTLLYLPRRVISFKDYCASFNEGFSSMMPAIFILCLAWVLSGICSADYLNLGGYLGTVVGAQASLVAFLPAIFFLVAFGLAFATGTSWGTFAILIPIAVTIAGTNETAMLLSVTAVLSGAVAGDHGSPISDTTILAATGSQCHHIDHVNTQLPYLLVVGVCTLAGYLVAGFTQNGFLGLGAAALLLGGVMAWICLRVPSVYGEEEPASLLQETEA